MLPLRKNKQENIPTEKVYRYQVREAEKSPVVLTYNIKQNMMLDKQVNFLERSKKMVVNRITVNQKVMFTAFTRKLNAAKMTHARIKGDVKMQQELREQALYGGRYGLTIEEEEMLHQIWKNQRKIYEEEEQVHNSYNGRRTSSLIDTTATTVKFQTPRRSFSCTSIPERPEMMGKDEVDNSQTSSQKVVRIKPTSAVTPRVQDATESGKRRTKSAVPLIKVLDADGESAPIMTEYEEVAGEWPSSGNMLNFNLENGQSMLPDIHDTSGQKAPNLPYGERRIARAKTACSVSMKRKEPHLSKNNVQRGHTSKAKQRVPKSNEADPPTQKGFFDEEDNGPSLLEIHKKRLEESDVMHRIKGLINSMSHLQPHNSMIDPDYYTHSVEWQAKQGWGNKKQTKSIYSTISENERRRAEGNKNIVSMTVKPLVCPK